ncbi:MAG: aldolase catalytic domain-containing protein [Ruminococcus sp.]|nr:aldolase catalytic domain-containing protein [Ruminococcus sp.]
MSEIKVLDCTLRDGGYCNKWEFGKENIKKIISGLCESGIEFIECGFLTNRQEHRDGSTLFTNAAQLSELIPQSGRKQMPVCMINYGEYSADDLPECSETVLEGIRVAFHKKDMIPALELCRQIKAKGYKIFVQAMVSLNYNDREFLELIERVNELEPYCFYIVDSFGVMKKKDLIRLFSLVENDLSKDIGIGFHSHNNMQLSYSNAQTLADMQTSHFLIIDSCIFGMGRGAGNLNTELFVEYLNDNLGGNYSLKPLLVIIDEILNTFYQRSYWGYSLPNYLSAKHNAHPNYAAYLDSKNTLTVEAMDDIFSLMDDSERSSFNREYIEKLYTEYMENGSVQEQHLAELSERIKGKGVLIIAPGRSSVAEKDRILPYAENSELFSVSINHRYSAAETDMIFVSNLRRFHELDSSLHSKCIITSNIPASDVYLKTSYGELLNDVSGVHDNAGMMLIRFLIKMGAAKLFICGMDGYSADPSQNYSSEDLNFYTRRAAMEQMNEGIGRMIKRFSEEIELEFITDSRFAKFSTGEM